MRVVHRFEKKAERTLKLLDDRLGKDGEFDVWVLVVKVLGKLRDAFRVGLSLELETLALQKCPKFLVIRDDAVVNN